MLSNDVRRALAELPEQQREAVVLRDVYGLRYREVGVVLGLSLPAVESLLFRARRRLRTRLRPAGGSLVIPMALRDNLAQTLPGFGFCAGEGGAAVVGAAGAAGVLVKLSSGPIAVKLTAGAVAIGAVGRSQSCTVVEDGDLLSEALAALRACAGHPGLSHGAGRGFEQHGADCLRNERQRRPHS